MHMHMYMYMYMHIMMSNSIDGIGELYLVTDVLLIKTKITCDNKFATNDEYYYIKIPMIKEKDPREH